MQSVVGGRLEDLQLFQTFLRKSHISSVILDVPAAYHTPLLSNAQLALTQAAYVADLTPPRIPFISTVTGRFVSEPDEIRRNLLDQLISPVLYQKSIEQIQRLGIRGIVELGGGSVLTRLNKAIVQEPSVTIAATDDISSVRLWLDGLAQPSAKPNVASATNSQVNSVVIPGQIVTLDATTDRRQRRRQQSAQYKTQFSSQNHSLPTSVALPATLSAANASSIREELVAKDSPKEHEVPEVLLATKQSVEATTIVNSTNDVANNEASHELEAFVRDFIVEHTGYPAEMVQMDWDLEADLGIDSIKQAQLFGELRELFEIDLRVAATGTLRTMRDIVSHLSTAGGKREWLSYPSAAEESVESLSIVEAAVLPETRSSDQAASEEIFSEEITGEEVISEEIVTEVTSRDDDSIANFMIDFVIDQTGYPPEMVVFDADLEADLGLDSIKLAQLFGELRNQFSLPLELGNRTSLAQIRTLNDILSLFQSRPSTASMTAGRAWGEVHATSLQHWLVAEVDALESTSEDALVENAAKHNSTIAYGLALNESHAINGYDADEWWMGVAAGAKLAVQTLKAHSATIEGYSSSDSSPSTATAEASAYTELVTESERFHSKDNDPVTIEALGDSLSEPSITHRYALRMVDSPIPRDVFGPAAKSDGSTIVWTGAAIVLGDNPVQKKLCDRLRGLGVSVYHLRSEKTRESIIEVIDRIWKVEPVTHAFITTPFDATATIELNSQEWKDRREAGMLAPFWMCQHWFKRLNDANLFPKASLVNVINLGGSFGLDEQVIAPESGCATGLLKAIMVEAWMNGHRRIPIKSIDFSGSDKPSAIVEAVFTELSFTSYDMEVSWASGVRKTIQAARSPITIRKPNAITQGGNWIFTGGGRGITALVAEELSAKYSLVANLVGTAPVPNIPDEWRTLDDQGRRDLQLHIMQQARTDKNPTAANPMKAWQNVEKAIEIDSTLRRLRERGIEAYYYSCDCNSPEDVLRTVSEIRKKSGPITGCLHGAGFGQDARFDRKRPEKVDQCFAAKFDGAITLMEATQSDPLEYFIGFGSISGRFGANGHTDYSAANDSLAKVIDWYASKRPEVRCTTFHWHAWGDVGMATKPETKLALEMIDMRFMPAKEGVMHLLREIEAGAPDREILITDDRYYRAFYPNESLASQQAHTEIGEALVSPDLKIVFNPTRDIFLKEHCLSGMPLLPMVIGLESLVEAAAIHEGWKPNQHAGPIVTIRKLKSLRGLRFFTDRSVDAYTVATVNDKASIDVQLKADFHARDGKLVDPARVYFSATISAAEHVEDLSGKRLDWSIPKASRLTWENAIYPPEGSEFYVGPAFRVLRQVSLAKGKIYGKILAPASVELSGVLRGESTWRTPSAVLDACLFATGILAWNHVRPGINLPVSIDRIDILRVPKYGEMLTIESRFIKEDDRSAWFDFCVWASDGSVCVEAHSYRTTWLEADKA